MDDCCSGKGKGKAIDELAQRADQRRVLQGVLAIKAIMFVVELSAGVVAKSSAMIADSVDMLGDALVYGLSLYAMSRGTRWEAGAALTKGLILLGFGVAVIVEVGFKIAYGIVPSSQLMLIFGSLALAANASCLAMFWQFRKLNVNMSSTFECSRNDVISNAAVLIAGGLVAASGAAWPDVVVGAIIAVIFLRSARRIVAQAWPIWRRGAADGTRTRAEFGLEAL